MKKYILFLMSILMAGGVFADTSTFNFEDPKKVNSISIMVDSPLEPLFGLVTGIRGSITLDLENRKGISGQIKAEADAIKMANGMMTKVLQGNDWLSVKQYPMVTFVFKDIVEVKKKTDTFADIVISGDLTLKGVTRNIQIPVTLTYLKGKLKDRNHKGEGDLLAVRSEFTIDRTAFGINPDFNPAIVAKEIKVVASIIGYAAQGN